MSFNIWKSAKIIIFLLNYKNILLRVTRSAIACNQWPATVTVKQGKRVNIKVKAKAVLLQAMEALGGEKV
jgi:hypothetical protein